MLLREPSVYHWVSTIVFLSVVLYSQILGNTFTEELAVENNFQCQCMPKLEILSSDAFLWEVAYSLTSIFFAAK